MYWEKKKKKKKNGRPSKAKGKKILPAKTKSGIIGSRLHLNSEFQLALTINPQEAKKCIGQCSGAFGTLSSVQVTGVGRWFGPGGGNNNDAHQV